MSWAEGLILWLIGGGVAMWIVGLLLERSTPDEHEHDWLADYKRKLDQNARRQRWGGR